MVNEIGDNTAILRVHIGAIGVEDADYTDGGLMNSEEIKAEGFSGAFTFVVAGSGAAGVDVAVVGFGLGVDKRIAIDFRGRGMKEASPCFFC